MYQFWTIYISKKRMLNLCLQFFFHETEVAILNLYVAPHATFSNIVDVISNALGHFHLNGPIVLVGDFSIDMLQNSDRTKELENYMC
jgi:hypothetical protein